jgi:hypothetical protein
MKKTATVVIVMIISLLSALKLSASDSSRKIQFEKGLKTGVFKKMTVAEKTDTVSVVIESSVPDFITDEEVLKALNSEDGVYKVKEQISGIEYFNYFLNYKIKYDVLYIYNQNNIIKSEIKPGYKQYVSWYLIFYFISIIFMIISNVLFYLNKRYTTSATLATTLAAAAFTATTLAVLAAATTATLAAAAAVLAAATLAAAAFTTTTATTEKVGKQYIFYSIIFYIAISALILITIFAI